MLTTIDYQTVSNDWKDVPKDATIVAARITSRMQQIGDQKPQVWVRIAGCAKELFLFDFYNDEIDFTEAELVGLTRAQANDLYHSKDVAWLRSGL